MYRLLQLCGEALFCGTQLDWANSSVEAYQSKMKSVCHHHHKTFLVRLLQTRCQNIGAVQ